MKRVLIATDFSEVAKNAAEYALNYAKEYGMTPHLIHAYAVALPPTENPVPFLPDMTAVESIQQEKMLYEINRLQEKFPEMQIGHSLFIGDIFEGMSEELEKNDVSITIMGTTGENKSTSIWGSHSMKAMRELNGHVLIVPHTAKYKHINNILLTADLQNFDEDLPHQDIKKWVKETGAHLYILNVQPLDPLQDEYTLNEMPYFEGVPHKFQNIEDSDISAGIKFFLQKNPVDVIIVVPKKYNFFEKLFHKSKSEMITQSSDVPVVAIHFK